MSQILLCLTENDDLGVDVWERNVEIKLFPLKLTLGIILPEMNEEN